MNPIDNRAAANMMLSREDEILLATTIAALDPAAHINASIIEQQQHRNLGLVVAAAAAAAASAAIHVTVPAPPFSSAPAGDARHEDIRHIRLHRHLHNPLSPLDVPTTNAFGVPLTANGVGHHVMHLPQWNNTLPIDRTAFTSAFSHSEPQLVGDHCPVITVPGSNPLTSARALAAAAQGNVDDQTIDILLSPIPASSRTEDMQGDRVRVMVNKRRSAPRHFRDEPANYNQPTIERASDLPSGERRSAHSFQPYQLSRVRQGAMAGSSSSARSGNISRARRLCHVATSEPASRTPNQPASASVVLPIAMSDEAAQHVVVPIAPPAAASFSVIAGHPGSSVIEGYPMSMSNVQPPFTSVNSNTSRQHSAEMPLHRSLYQGTFPLESVRSSIMNPSHGVTGIPSPLMVPPDMRSSSVEGFQSLDSHPHQCRLDHHYHHQLAFRQHCPSANASTAAHIPLTPPHHSLHQSQGPTLMPNTLQSYALLNSIASMGCPALATSSYASGAHSIYDRPSSNFHQVDSRSFNALGGPPGPARSAVNHGRNAQHSSRGVQQMTPTVHPLNFLHSAVLANRLRQQEEERQRSIEFYQQLHAIQQQSALNQQTGYGSGRLLRLPPPVMLAHASFAMPPVSVVPQPVELMVIPPSTAEVATAAHIVLNGTGIGMDAELSHHHASVGFRQASAVAAAAGAAVVEPQPVGISPEKIEQHSSRVNYMSADEKTGTERERCTVCLVDFEKADELRSLRCSHMFHVECIDRWLIYNKKCPICRVDMDRPKAALSHSTSCNPTPSATVFRRAI